MSESTVRTQEDLGEELCKYCPIPKEAQGIHGTPNGYSSCEGCRCEEAYEHYKEEQTDVCDLCDTAHDLDYMVETRRLEDGETVLLCIACSYLPEASNLYEV